MKKVFKEMLEILKKGIQDEVVADREPIEVLEEKEVDADREPIEEEDEKDEVSEVNETGADREPIEDVKNKIIKIRNKGEKVWKGWIERLRY